MMRRALILSVLAVTLAGCAPYEAMPTSSYQWQRRQDRIEREWQAEQAAAPANPVAGGADAKDPT